MSGQFLFRALRDLGSAAWGGGALMGASGLNAAADQAGLATDRDTVVSAGWARWSPFFRAAVAAQLIGSAGEFARTRSATDAVGLGLAVTAVGTQLGAMKLGGNKNSQEVVHALEWTIPALVGLAVLNAARGVNQ